MTRYQFLPSRLAPLALALAIVVPQASHAQGPPPDQPDMTIDAKASREVVDGLIKYLNESYVFPETAKKMEARLRERLDHKDYEGVTSAKTLAKQLTEHLQEVSHDKHLHVVYGHDPLPAMRDEDSPSDEARERMRHMGAGINYGFEKVERMGGNVGYLELRGFFPADLGGETAAAAMNFLANTDALIIDLRRNGGGEPSMVALLCSYLFGGEPVHLNDLYDRPHDSTHQWWTLPYVPGKRYGNKPVYVLTSRHTFSAAEEFTYNLKTRHRATIVGETTGGGAHPGAMRRINDHFAVFVPNGRAINPVTHTNWEGTGISPDVSVPSDLALKTAYLSALRGFASKDSSTGKPTDPMHAAQLQRAIEAAEKELDELKSKTKPEALNGKNG